MLLRISQLFLYSLVFYPGHWQSGVIILWVIMLINISNLKVSPSPLSSMVNSPASFSFFPTTDWPQVSKGRSHWRNCIKEKEDYTKIRKHCKTMTLEGNSQSCWRGLRKLLVIEINENVWRNIISMYWSYRGLIFLKLLGMVGEWGWGGVVRYTSIISQFCQVPRTICTSICGCIYGYILLFLFISVSSRLRNIY